MTTYLLAGPAGEPISREKAKAFLRIEDAAEDDLIDTLITAARLHVESTTSSALLRQSWRVVLDGPPAEGAIKLALGPLIAVTALRAYDGNGNAVELDPDEILPDIGAAPPRLIVPANISGMPALRAHRALEIDFDAGYGDTPEDVPADLNHALLALIAYWFEHRDQVIVAGSGAVVPAGYERLIAPYKRVRL